MKKCSIIIPIYKGKDYIDECLKSIVNQTYSNWELIIMDDGSPDDSYDYISKIIEDYQDYDIRLLRQENRGVAETRNGCVLLANGEYITFIDQDDTIAEDYLERLMSAAEEACADIALCGYARKTNEGKIIQSVTISELPWSKYRIITPWARVYKRSFLIDKDVKYLTTPCGEDIYFTLLAYSKTEKIATIQDYAGYYWRFNPESVSNTKQKDVSIAAEACETFEKTVAALSSDRLSDPLLEEYFFVKACVYRLLNSTNAESKEEINSSHDLYFAFLEKHFPNYRKNKYMSIFRPKGECLSVRFIVWFIITLKKLGLSRPFTRFWCKIH
jgi:glycosyltransferase involved in cell wall biosynthesis